MSVINKVIPFRSSESSGGLFGGMVSFVFGKITVLGSLFGSMILFSQGQIEFGMGLAVLSLIILFWSVVRIILVLSVIASVVFIGLDVVSLGAIPLPI